MRDDRRSHPETRELADDVADLGADGQTRRPPFAQASDGIRDCLAVDGGVKAYPPLRMDEEITGYGDGHTRARGVVQEKDVAVEPSRAATEAIDLYHWSSPWQKPLVRLGLPLYTRLIHRT
jgi:hypothetical protein